jgi:hypothetical protein
MLLFGGNTATPDAPLLSNETFALSFADGDLWVPVSALGRSPAPRAGQGAIYDPLRDRMIVFWGHSYTYGRQDCAELDLSGAPTWQPFQLPGWVPPARGDFVPAYDAGHDQALLVGGQEIAGTEVSFPNYLYADFSANPVRTPPPLHGPPLAVLGLAPNPTRDIVNVAFDLPVDATVHARIYTAAGRLVRDLGDRPFTAGQHILLWDGKDERGGSPPSGVYFARLSMLGRDFSGKFVLLR